MLGERIARARSGARDEEGRRRWEEGGKKERKIEEKEKEEEGRETVTQRRKIRLEISSGAHCWPFVSRSQGTRNTRISRNNARASSNAVEGTGQRGGEEKKGGHRRRMEEGGGVDAKHTGGQSAEGRERGERLV